MTASKWQLVESNAELTKFNKAHEFCSYSNAGTPSWTAQRKLPSPCRGSFLATRIGIFRPPPWTCRRQTGYRDTLTTTWKEEHDGKNSHNVGPSLSPAHTGVDRQRDRDRRLRTRDHA